MNQPKIEDSFFLKRAEAAFTFANVALSELNIINSPFQGEQYKMVSHHPFNIYRASLTYMFTNEFCKLFAKVHPNPTKNKSFNVASVIKANQEMLEIFGDQYKTTFDKNESVLGTLLDDPLVKKLFVLRDTKLAHLDGTVTDINKIHSFPIEEIEKLFGILKDVYGVMFSMYQFYDIHLQLDVPMDSQTNNFIRYNTMYKEIFDREAAKDQSLFQKLWG